MPNVLSTCTRHKALQLSLHFNSFCKLEPWSVSRNTARSCLSLYAPRPADLQVCNRELKYLQIARTGYFFPH